MAEEKVNALVNIGQLKVAEKFYDDLASPVMKKVGKALETVIDISNTILWPVKLVNAKTQLYFENNLKKYKEQLDKIPEENIIAVAPEIAVPILDKFQYVTNEHLSDAFVKLLTAASSSETVSLAHPGFIEVISRLSSDEAIILKYFHENFTLAVLDLFVYEENKETFSEIFRSKTLISKHVELSFPENDKLYLENLSSLGIIQLFKFYQPRSENDYEIIQQNEYVKIETVLKNRKYITSENWNDFKRMEKHMYLKTNFGQLFIHTCIPNSQ